MLEWKYRRLLVGSRDRFCNLSTRTTTTKSLHPQVPHYFTSHMESITYIVIENDESCGTLLSLVDTELREQGAVGARKNHVSGTQEYF